MARLVGEHLGRKLGQTVIVDNKPGANGIIGMGYVAKTAPDGYTMLYAITGLIQNASLYKKLPYDPFKDFQPISLVGLSPVAFVVAANSPAKSMAEFIEMARKVPSSYSSNGVGSTPHLYRELLASAGNVKMVHVAYKGESPAIVDIIGGQVCGGFVSLGLASAQVAGGKVRVLAVAARKRSPLMPSAATMAELGFPGFEAAGFSGLLFPARVPKDITHKVSSAVNSVLKMPEVAQRIVEMGFEPGGDTPEEYAALLRSDFAHWDALIKRNKIELD